GIGGSGSAAAITRVRGSGAAARSGAAVGTEPVATAIAAVGTLSVRPHPSHGNEGRSPMLVSGCLVLQSGHTSTGATQAPSPVAAASVTASAVLTRAI